MSPAARHPSPRTYLVSACLLGERCRYDGSSNDSPSVRDFLKGHTVVPVCPEVLGGLPVPRMGCDLSSGDGQAVWQGTARVLRHDGLDLTDAFVSGAQRSRAAAPTASWAILKARSPSHVDRWGGPRGHGRLRSLAAGTGGTDLLR